MSMKGQNRAYIKETKERKGKTMAILKIMNCVPFLR